MNNFKTIPLNIELKISPFTDLQRLAERVVYELNGKITSSPLLVSSFNLEILQNLRKYSRRIRLGYLTAQEDWERSKLFEMVTENNFQAVHPHYSLVSEDFMNISKENDIEVNVWTVNEQSAIARQVNFGVNSIITDEVQMVKAFIKRSTS